MATWDDVDRVSLALPEAERGTRFGDRTWTIRGKAFAWVRPLRRADREALGDAAPEGEILGLRTGDVDEQLALTEGEPEYFFITPHFAGFPAVLVKLDDIPADRLEEAIAEAWVAQAPKRVAAAWLADREG